SSRGLHRTCPSIGSRRSVLRVTHQAHVSRLAAPAFAVSTGLWIPLAFRPVAFASWAFVSRSGVPLFLRQAYRRTAGPRRGFHVPHQRDATGVGVSCTPGSFGVRLGEECPSQR